MKIYIRQLRESDANISYIWRNNQRIWLHTGLKPDKIVTLEMEKEWVKDVLSRKDEKRFAICIKKTDEYIGNAQLTNINVGKAEIHVFIGKMQYWGKGIGTQALKLVMDYGFNKLKLVQIYGYCHPDNKSSLKACEKNGLVFKKMLGNKLFLICNKNIYEKSIKS